MFKKYRIKSFVISSLIMMASANANSDVISHTLDFDNIQPPRTVNPDFSALQMSESDYGGFNWGDGWYATSESNNDTYLSTSSSSLLINRTVKGEGFQFEGFEYWSRGGDGDGRRFFYVLYGSDGQAIYNSDTAGEDLRLSATHNALISNVNTLVYGLAIGFINGGNNDGWRYLGVDEFKFSVDPASLVNTRIPGFNIATVPLPATLPLFMAGLGFFGFVNRRSK